MYVNRKISCQIQNKRYSLSLSLSFSLSLCIISLFDGQRNQKARLAGGSCFIQGVHCKVVAEVNSIEYVHWTGPQIFVPLIVHLK